MSIKISGLQAVQDEIEKEFRKLSKSSYITVGIHETAGVRDDSGLTVATVGAINHFGGGDIPARPWLDVGVESGAREYLGAIEDGVSKGLDNDKIMDQVGALAVGSTQEYILNLSSPPNSPSTIKKKGSSNPLIDTSNMIQSITYEIARVEPEEGIV